MHAYILFFNFYFDSMNKTMYYKLFKLAGSLANPLPYWWYF